MINRPNYMKTIETFMDKPLVKILPGIRRCDS